MCRKNYIAQIKQSAAIHMKAVFAEKSERITLGKKLIEKYGKRFAVVCENNQVILVPLDKNQV